MLNAHNFNVSSTVSALKQRGCSTVRTTLQANFFVSSQVLHLQGLQDRKGVAQGSPMTVQVANSSENFLPPVSVQAKQRDARLHVSPQAMTGLLGAREVSSPDASEELGMSIFSGMNLDQPGGQQHCVMKQAQPCASSSKDGSEKGDELEALPSAAADAECAAEHARSRRGQLTIRVVDGGSISCNQAGLESCAQLVAGEGKQAWED